jgi:putative ABC transport system permease protein
MIKNYLKTTFRNLIKTRLFSFINIIGLAIGISVFLLIIFYVNFEKSYDTFHNDSNKIYRLRYERTSKDGESVRFASCCPPAGIKIRETFPEVEKLARIYRMSGSVSTFNETNNEEIKFYEEKIFYAEPQFFEIFNFKFISGDPVAELISLDKAFVSQTTAKKYFGNKNPIGKVLSIDKKNNFTIVGVFEDVPTNSHIKFDFVLSYPNVLNLFPEWIEEAWGYTGWFTYIKFRSDADIEAFKQKLPALVEEGFGEVLKKYELTMELPLQPITDIHLTSHFMQEFEENGDAETINILLIIAMFILIIAWVNYINLTTARSLTRAREVGLRKVVGANKSQLRRQFFIETAIIQFFAILVALMLIELIIPYFFNLTELNKEIRIFSETWIWYTIIGIFLSGIFVSGIYPVFILTSFKPIIVLKGKLANQNKGFNIRRVLVIFQFLMAIILITATITVFSQIGHLKKQNLGISIDKIVAVRVPSFRDDNFMSKLLTFKNELLKQSNIENFCFVSEVPGRQIFWDAGGIKPAGTNESKNYQIVGIDYDFAHVFEVEFVAGRNFSREFGTDTSALIFNETAVKWMGFESAEAAINQKVDYWGTIFHIVGVMKNYRQQSAKVNFEPHIYRLLPEGHRNRGFFAIKINDKNSQEALQIIQKKYENYFPGNPFDYFFIEEYYEQQYKSDNLLGSVFTGFSILAIIITTLGLLGLTSFMVMQKLKDISIRKVLGANAFTITSMYVIDFLKLIGISFLISLPISYFFLNKWLENYAERIQLQFWIFILPLIIAIVIACITVISMVLKASRLNPIDNLKYE